jgi:hypothetical protein
VWQQASSRQLKISPMLWQGENTTTTDELILPAEYEGTLGTRVNAISSGKLFHIFYQQNGNDITRITRNLSSSNWDPFSLPV